MTTPNFQPPTSKATERVLSLATFVLAAVCASGLSAQIQETAKFEVSSVKSNKSNAPLQVLPTLQPGGRVFAINLPLREFIRIGYGLRENQIVFESPLSEARFDLEARAGATATSERAGAMLRTLLAERFGLKTHPETRQLPVYILERVNADRLGPQLKKSGTECGQLRFPSGPGAAAPPPPPPPAAFSGAVLGPTELWAECPSMFFPGGWSLRSMNLPAFAYALERIVRRAIIDQTGLTGNFDMDITYAPEAFEMPFPIDGPGAAPPAQRTGPSVFTALRDQLGLRLQAGRAPVNVLVVDSVQQPTEN